MRLRAFRLTSRVRSPLGLPAVRTLRSAARQPRCVRTGARTNRARRSPETGVHFGHQTRRWNPKMKRFILAERNGIYIIDLQQSLDFIDKAYEFIKETVAHGGTVLYVGT